MYDIIIGGVFVQLVVCFFCYLRFVTRLCGAILLETVAFESFSFRFIRIHPLSSFDV